MNSFKLTLPSFWTEPASRFQLCCDREGKIQVIQLFLQGSRGSEASMARILPLLQLTSDLVTSVFVRRRTTAIPSKSEILFSASDFSPLVLILSAFQLYLEAKKVCLIISISSTDARSSFAITIIRFSKNLRSSRLITFHYSKVRLYWGSGK